MSHKGNANRNQNVVPFHIHLDGCEKKEVVVLVRMW